MPTKKPKKGVRGPEDVDIDSSYYRPKHKDSKKAYEEILSVLQQSLGGQPHDVLRDAADEVIAILKDDKLKDPERQKGLEKLLLGPGAKLSNEKFAKYVQLGKQINDYGVSAEADEDENQVGGEDGVAVIFESDEEEEEEDDLDQVAESDEVCLLWDLDFA